MGGPRVMLVGSGQARYRRYILEHARGLGLELVLARPGPPGWEAPLLADHLQLPDRFGAG
ncbi:MAG: hypothetical protein K6T75_03445 [Acetobacteraceae bacterium]|nr:hypothetical protein [Acetobacteraceae bacterium]